MDELVKKIAGFGLPGILFVIATATSGGSVVAVVTLLSSLGGPLGLLGGLGLLGLVGIVGEYIAGFGIENILKLIYSERSKSESVRLLLKEIQDLPITDDLKLKLKHNISPVVITEPQQGPAPKTVEKVVEDTIQATDANINDLLNKPVLIENQQTKRYLFSDGEPIKGNRGDEGGWLASSGFESPKIVGTDANYYNRALWKIIPSGDSFLIENQQTKRYLFSDGEPIKGNRGDEGGWLASSGFESPKIVGTDANYYDRALWKIIPSGDSFLIENQQTKRYLFSDGEPIKGNRGDEGGWLASSGFESPKIVGTDSNYYDRALWKITQSFV
ncbi:hypothetical protein [Dendronalium phyllosphericum]|uniref:hypothetical protein n=1 Tax=Dendronalium phyllosphericum TaxID=2840445 RepID=UPI001CEDC71F|nr:hypothetical protein [Dendronalium phyllosphericum]